MENAGVVSRMIRPIAAILIAAMAAGGVYWVTIAPLRCNRRETAVVSRTKRIAFAPRTIASPIARENIEWMEKCVCFAPAETNLQMLAAANYRTLGRTDDAIAAYYKALRWDERPEIYVELGLTELEGGYEASGRAHLYRGALFNPDLLKDAEGAVVAKETRQRVLQRDRDLLARRQPR